MFNGWNRFISTGNGRDVSQIYGGVNWFMVMHSVVKSQRGQNVFLSSIFPCLDTAKKEERNPS